MKILINIDFFFFQLVAADNCRVAAPFSGQVRWCSEPGRPLSDRTFWLDLSLFVPAIAGGKDLELAELPIRLGCNAYLST